MANEEQVALLKAGVKGWNEWREKEPDHEIDLSKADLFRANLSEANLSGANLSGAYLPEAYLRGTNLNEANLSGAELTAADLTGAYIRGTILNKARLHRAIFHGAILVEVNLSEVDLWQAVLVKVNLSGLNLSRADLSGAHLIEADLSGADLTGADLHEADLSGANLSGANLSGANLSGANLSEVNLSGLNLSGADLSGVNLSGLNLRGANLSGANLSGANLSGANLTGANLINSNLVETDITNAKISKSKVYGVNVWDLEGEFKEQKDLIITPMDTSPITVDNIKVAQFVYLILNNKEIRDVINTLTSKTVLILGRFAIPKRKKILDALRDKLREYDLLPIVFDFDRPVDKDFTETIKTLAGMSYFVIADVTNPKSSPLELQATVPDYQIPFVPIIQEGEKPFSMMANLKSKYSWVLKTVSYDSVDTLIEILKPLIIDPAMKKRTQLRKTKAKKPRITSGRKWRAKKKESKP